MSTHARSGADRPLAAVTLDDKYTLDRGRIYLSGIQALVRLPLLQRRRDRALGLNTAGFISGYRGSPLGGLDQALWRVRAQLDQHRIRFQPGLNEDLAATAVWGSQQATLYGDATVDGVFALWYGKGPGVDRCGDVFKHGNAAGTGRYGGVLLVAGDDHACKSSTLPHQSEYAFMDAGIPVLYPSNVQEVLDYGLYGWALSRYSGCWVGLKVIAETADASAAVAAGPERVDTVLPEDLALPPDGVSLRWPDPPLQQEIRLHRHKLYAALAFARANRLDRIVVDSPNARFGIVTTGKSYLDVRQALDDLGIDDAEAARIGLRVYKVGMSWPLERDGARDFARGLEEVLVVEEKRALIENQFKEQLYNWDESVRPRVLGKFDDERRWILPSTGELTPARIARAIADRIKRFYHSDAIDGRLRFLEQKETALARTRPETLLARTPHFCAGCPHNTSTRVPEGSRAVAGIGCHYMATWMDRDTSTFTQMGGEGVPWIGQAPFTTTQHIFANLGDGTYYHSGLLAIRASVAAGVNITYKILYNDAVAMTGGQPVDGPLTVPGIVAQTRAEGVAAVRVVSDEPDKYRRARLGSDVSVHHRDDLDAVQRALRDAKGVTVLIYDQTCASEKRRRRKRGTLADPDVDVVINERVCEGCGDCGVRSNCLAVAPVETAFGRKRAIDASACNKDLSCLKGFCPSFVTVRGGGRRRPAALTDDDWALPEPTPAALPDAPGRGYDILITGVGGTGVVTVGALLGMAAHLENKAVSVLDMTGLAQKFGAVISHVRIAARDDDLHAARIAAGNARLLLGVDALVAASADALAKLDPAHSVAVVNAHEAMPAAFTRDPDVAFPAVSIRDAVAASCSAAEFVDATRSATALLGDAIAVNLFMLGYAYQRGLLPLSEDALLRAVELNGVAVAMNRAAFLWGRRAAHDGERVAALYGPASTTTTALPTTLDEIVAHRAAFLERYQHPGYARRFETRVRAVEAAERERAPGLDGLAVAVARGYAKLLAYKDEYEVARLYSDGEFRKRLDAVFDGDYRLEFHLAPSWLNRLSRPDGDGRPMKRVYGGYMLTLFRLLAKGKLLRGTPFDPFGYSAERRAERRLIGDYEALLDEIVDALDADRHAAAVELAALPELIRGYGPVKAASIAAAAERRDTLLARFRAPPTRRAA